MSAFGKRGSRCDKCGKFSNNRMGEYVRQDGTCGYILADEDSANESDDICTDCVEQTEREK